jgi:hypothetical protein
MPNRLLLPLQALLLCTVISLPLDSAAPATALPASRPTLVGVLVVDTATTRGFYCSCTEAGSRRDVTWER